LWFNCSHRRPIYAFFITICDKTHSSYQVKLQKEICGQCKKRHIAWKKLWNQRWRPRSGCDGRIMAKFLITIQVNLVPIPSETWRRQHRFAWIVAIINFAIILPSQPLLVCQLWFHNFFHAFFLHWSHLFFSLAVFGLIASNTIDTCHIYDHCDLLMPCIKLNLKLRGRTNSIHLWSNFWAHFPASSCKRADQYLMASTDLPQGSVAPLGLLFPPRYLPVWLLHATYDYMVNGGTHTAVHMNTICMLYCISNSNPEWFLFQTFRIPSINISLQVLQVIQCKFL